MDMLYEKVVVLQNGGSYYRVARDYYEQTVWRGVVDCAISHEADLMGSAPWPETLVIPPVDVDFLRDFRADRSGRCKIVVGHYPGNRVSKGTDSICAAIEMVKDEKWFRDRIEFRRSAFNFMSPVGVVPVPWRDHLRRLAQCDVVIDQIMPELDGKPFGEWCNTALEAATLGCAVIVNSRDTSPYERTYGRKPDFDICNTTDEMIDVMKRYAESGGVGAAGHHAQWWAEDCHSVEATAPIIRDIYTSAMESR